MTVTKQGSPAGTTAGTGEAEAPPRRPVPVAPPVKKAASAYDRYIDYRRFAIAVAAFVLILVLPISASMRDVAVEYAAGRDHGREFFARELFGAPYADVEQWQALTARSLEAAMRQGALGKAAVLKRDMKALSALGLEPLREHYDRYRALVEGMDEARVADLMSRAYRLHHDELSYEMLDKGQQARADLQARNLRTCLALVAFVVICFLTEAIPLPGVAFCVGLILVFSGVVSRKDVASLYWSDAAWFIMGSLMFAAAFVKTGVDKRICLLVFRTLRKPHVGMVTAMIILVVSPAASFISDHALAAIFLPIAMILYNNSLTNQTPSDPELAKMLMITIAMACNIGGFGAPSGGARNVIMIGYLEDMFGYSFSYGQWLLFGMPFVLIMMPILWLLIRWRFKPQIRDLRPAMEALQYDIDRMGGWNRNQIVAITVFLLMLAGWITESNLLEQLIGVRLGIGVIAIAGAVTYLLTGVVNWRDYQEKVDWGVVWLYAGALIFGYVIDRSGAAYWLARSIVTGLSGVGLASGPGLLGAAAVVTTAITNLMADGPAAAAVGPITLNMAAVQGQGTVLVPFMALATACSSSFAYLLIIGTPPNAIVYSSGYLQAKDFLRVGVFALAIAFALLLVMALFYWPLLGFGGLPPIPS